MADAAGTDPFEVFRILVEEFGAKTEVLNQSLISHFPIGFKLVPYFRRHQDYFAVFENDAGEAKMVGARLKDFKLCLAYASKGSRCNRANCPEVHLCRDHVGGLCKQGASCTKDHHFQSHNNIAIIRRLRIHEFEEKSLLDLIRMNVPQVCRWYNKNDACKNGDACTRFHICSNMVIKRCVGNACVKDHTFDATHTKRLVSIYSLEDLTTDEIFQKLILHRVKHRPQGIPMGMMGLDFTELLRGLGQHHDSNDDDDDDDDDDHDDDDFLQNPRRGAEPALTAGDNDEMRMLREALGEDDLSDLLSYQLEVDNQRQVLSDHTKGDVQAPSGEVRPNPTRVLMYTGYAPQEDKKYICGASLKGECPRDANECQDAHFINEFLWQVQVEERWYNLDTVNDDVERAYKAPDEADYITMMPTEVTDESGKLMNITFRRMRAKVLTDERNDGDSFPVRRLTTRPSLPKLPDGEHRMNPDFPNLFRRKFTRDRALVQKRIAQSVNPFVQKIEKITVTEEETEPLKGDEKPTRSKPLSPDSVRKKRILALGGKSTADEAEPVVQQNYRWEVEVNGAWLSLTNAAPEIETAHRRREIGYVTVLPTDGQNLINLNFKEMVAISIDEEDINVYKLRRVSQDDVEEYSSDSDVETEMPTQSGDEGSEGGTEATDYENQNIQKTTIWQIEMNDEWLELNEIQEDLEKAFLSGTWNYRTKLPGDSSKPLTISFHSMEGSVFHHGANTEDLYSIRRIPPPENHSESTGPDDKTSEDIEPLKTDVPKSIKEKSLKSVGEDGVMPKQTKASHRKDDTSLINQTEVSAAMAVEHGNDTTGGEPALKEFYWEWSEDGLTWISYSPEISGFLEQGYMLKKLKGKLKTPGGILLVNYSNMTQANQSTGATYQIQRVSKETV